MSEGCSPHHYFSLSFQPDCVHTLFLTPPLFYSALFFHHHLSPKSLPSPLCHLLETYPFSLALFLINPFHYFLKYLLCLPLFHCLALAHAFPTPPQLPTVETLLTKVTAPLCLLYTTTVQQHCLSQPCWCPLGALCGQAVHPLPSLCWQAQLRVGGLSLGRLLLSSSISSCGTWR